MSEFCATLWCGVKGDACDFPVAFSPRLPVTATVVGALRAATTTQSSPQHRRLPRSTAAKKRQIHHQRLFSRLLDPVFRSSTPRLLRRWTTDPEDGGDALQKRASEGISSTAADAVSLDDSRKDNAHHPRRRRRSPIHQEVVLVVVLQQRRRTRFP